MTTIAPLPVLSRTSPTFKADLDAAFLSGFNASITGFNTVAGEVNTAASNAATSAGEAATQAGLATTNGAAQVALAADQVTLAAGQAALAAGQVALATTQANLSAASAAAAASAASAAAWVNGGTYALNASAISQIDYQTYRKKTASSVTATDPSADNTNWVAVGADSGIRQVTTATTATTLTSTPTLLQITPTGYGVTVTLPNATACNVGGPLHCIDNRSAYPVRVANSAGTLLGFIYAGVVSYVALDDNSTAAGVWAISSNELVGASAQLLTANMAYIASVIDIGSSQELIVGINVAATDIYAVVYNRANNTFGSVTLVRTGSYFTPASIASCLQTTNAVLVVSCESTGAAFQAVVLSVSGTAITVNTAATATLSANQNAPGLADGCVLIACNGSFVTSYIVSTPAAQIRALSVSGTTVTIGAASVLGGTAGGLIAASASGVIAVSAATTNLYTMYYGVSGATLTIGTGVTTTSGTMTVNKLAALGTRWYVGYNDGGSKVKGGVISLAGTVATISTVTLFSAGTLEDAIIVGSNKVLILNNQAAVNANILTDTAGTASAGTAITLSNGASRTCLYASGTDVYTAERDSLNNIAVREVSCSGASPVVTIAYPKVGNSASASDYAYSRASNAVLRKAPVRLVGTDFVQVINTSDFNVTQTMLPRVRGGIPSLLPAMAVDYTAGIHNPATRTYAGLTESQAWQAASAVITKMECVA